MNNENNISNSNENYILCHYGLYKMIKEYEQLKDLENRKNYMMHLTQWYMKEKAALSYADSK